MSCNWCVHWVPEDGRYSQIPNQIGECRRYPSAIKKPADYKCGEFFQVDIGMQGESAVQMFYERMQEARTEAASEKSRRLVLEKANKELRRKLKSKV